MRRRNRPIEFIPLKGKILIVAETVSLTEGEANVNELESTPGKENRADGATLRVVSFIAGQTTILVALLYYFGWARTQALLAYFGINSAIAHLSVDDYVLRSLDIVVRLLVAAGVLVLLFLGAHRWLAATLSDSKNSRRTNAVRGICIACGFLSMIAALLGFYNWIVYSPKYPFVPIMLASGISLIGYGIYIGNFTQSRRPVFAISTRILLATIIAVNVASGFWAAAVYAGVSGTSAASQMAADVNSLPSVVIYSDRPLDLTGPGVMIRHLPLKDNRYRYSYSGLKLLFYYSDRYFLISDDWQRGRDPVFLIAGNDGGLRFEFYANST